MRNDVSVPESDGTETQIADRPDGFQYSISCGRSVPFSSENRMPAGSGTIAAMAAGTRTSTGKCSSVSVPS